MRTRRSSFSGLASCGTACVVVGVFVLGCSVQHRAEDPGTQKDKEEMQTIEKENIDAFIKIEQLTEIEDKRVHTRYRLELLKPVPLQQLLESDMVHEILAIGATVKFQILPRRAADEWEKKHRTLYAVVVGVSKGEFTCEDEIVFSVIIPSARS